MPIKNENKTTHEKLSVAGHKGAEARRGPDGNYHISEETREKLSEAGKKGASVRYGKDYKLDDHKKEPHQENHDSENITDKIKNKVHDAKEAIKNKFNN
jgi:hypothetical protein